MVPFGSMSLQVLDNILRKVRLSALETGEFRDGCLMCIILGSERVGSPNFLRMLYATSKQRIKL